MKGVALLLLVVVAASKANEAHGLDLGRGLKWMDRRSRALKVRQRPCTRVADACLCPAPWST
jgi:hypothetical protein